MHFFLVCIYRTQTCCFSFYSSVCGRPTVLVFRVCFRCAVTSYPFFLPPQCFAFLFCACRRPASRAQLWRQRPTARVRQPEAHRRLRKRKRASGRVGERAGVLSRTVFLPPAVFFLLPLNASSAHTGAGGRTTAKGGGWGGNKEGRG